MILIAILLGISRCMKKEAILLPRPLFSASEPKMQVRFMGVTILAWAAWPPIEANLVLGFRGAGYARSLNFPIFALNTQNRCKTIP